VKKEYKEEVGAKRHHRDDQDSDENQGKAQKRLKRTVEDTPQKEDQSEEPDQHMVYKSGSEEEYVPGSSKLAKLE
jgi:hypothetical protein